MSMFGAVAQALGQASPPQKSLRAQALYRDVMQGSAGSAGAAPAWAGAELAKPVLQLNPFPVTLRPQDYANPLSSGNPGGDLASLWAFRQLVDPVPGFSPYYAASMASTESVYRLIAGGASLIAANAFVASVIADARRALAAAQAYPNLDHTPGSWLPVFATPGDWSTATEAYSDLQIDLSGADSGNGAFTVLGQSHPDLSLNIGAPAGPGFAGTRGVFSAAGVGLGGLARSQAVGPGTSLRGVKMKYQTISLGRPWLSALLFSLGGWTLAGQPPGFCSSGDLVHNPGILPLIPSELLVATEVEVDGAWGAADKPWVDAAHAGTSSLAVGPFPVGQAARGTSIHVIGWVSSFVPRSPQG
jgi:hypothetical protein